MLRTQNFIEPKIFSNTKFFLVPKNFLQDFFGHNIFLAKIIFDQQFLVTYNFFRAKILSGTKSFSKNLFGLNIFFKKYFWTQNFFGPKIYLGHKIILEPCFFWPKIFLDPNFFVDPKCFIPFFERFSHFPHAPAKDVCWIYSRINISCNLCIHLMFNKIPSQKNSFLAFCTWCLLRIEYNPLAALSSKNSKKFVEFLCVGAKIYSFLVFRKITFRIHLNFSPLACIIFQSLFDEITFHGNVFVC